MFPGKLRHPLSFTVKLRILVITVLVFLQASVFAQPVVATIAGTTVEGFSGDQGPAIRAQMAFPLGICFDPAGNMYIADFTNQCVRRVDAVTGIITTIAGSGGNNGFSGDGGPATSAKLNHPLRLCADKNDHLFIVDYENRRVRKVDLATGIITTVAGNGTANYVNGGLAVNGGLMPLGITVDPAGNLYISQPEMDPSTPTPVLISKLDLATGVITTVAGRGQPGDLGVITLGFSPPGITCDGTDRLYAAGALDGVVYKIDPVTGTITSVPLNVPMKQPMDVVLDGQGKLIVSDMTGAQVVRVDLQTGAGAVIAGNGSPGMGPDCVTATTSGINYPMGLAIDRQGNVCFSELLNNRVRKIFTPPVLPSMNILGPTTPTCAGQPATFTAQISDGSSGVYRWSVNGNTVNTNSDTYITSGLGDGEEVACEFTLTGAGACGVVSNKLIVKILPVVTPTISLSTPSVTLCDTHDAEFTALVTNAGNHPGYEWLLNGHPVGNYNSNIYDATGLADGDEIQCRLIADGSEVCSTVPPVMSAPVRIKIIPAAPPAIGISASANPICPGDSVVFTAAATNAGDHPAYQWLVNGIRTGATGNSYGSAYLKDGDFVSCIMDPGNAPCRTGQPVISDPVVMSVRKVPAIEFAFTDTTISPGSQITLRTTIQGNARSWQWRPADKLTDPVALSPLTVPMNTTTDFLLTAFSGDGCPVSRHMLVTVFYKLAMPGSFTPNGDGHNDVFRIPPFVSMELEEFSVYDRWGNRIFSSRNVHTGWDGTSRGHACAAGTYVYLIKGRSMQGQVLSKGTVLLVR